MKYNIYEAKTEAEKRAIYRFRYKVYIEEMGKDHITADHENKWLFDEADEKAVLFYSPDMNGNVVGTVRFLEGQSGFTKEFNDYFGIDPFAKRFPPHELAIIDRLMVDKANRSFQLGHELSLAIFLHAQKIGNRITFMTSDSSVMPMHLHYGWRCYREPVVIGNNKKRFMYLFFSHDYPYLQKVKSPFLPHVPEQWRRDKDDYIPKVEELIGNKLFVPKVSLVNKVLFGLLRGWSRIRKTVLNHNN